MLIILEGADGTGKTCLAQSLTAHIKKLYPNDPITYLHKGPPKHDWMNEYCKPITEWYHPTNSRHLILDRWHWGERVWPAIFGRESIMDDYAWKFTEDLIRRNGGVVIHCHQHIETQQEVMRARGEDIPDFDQLMRVMDAYDRIKLETRLPVYRYRWQSSNVPALINHAQAHQFRAAKNCYVTTGART